MEKREITEPSGLHVGITYNLKKSSRDEKSDGYPDDLEPDPPDSDAEYDDITTVLAIKAALESKNCRVSLLEVNKDLPVKLMEDKPDIVFNIAEGIGGRGRESEVPALLDLYGIPYTGSDETTLCIALDKALTKRILTSYHIKTPKYQVIKKEQKELTGNFHFPAIVKPNAEGSSKGISDVSVVTNRRELQNLVSRDLKLYKQDMLVEEYISGREFTVGIFGNGDDVHVFSPMEVCYIKKEGQYNVYSYNVKRNYKDYVRYKCPADIPKHIETEMMNTARKIYEVLSCRDFARIDFRLSPDEELYFIEINPLPGLAPGYSDFPMIAEFNGMSYDSLIWNVLKSALQRFGMESYVGKD